MADQSLQWLAGPGGTSTDTKAITVSAGSTIVAWLTDGSTNSVSGFGVSDGTAYTAATNSAVDGSNFVAGKIFYLQNASAGVHTVVGTTGGGAAQIFLAEVQAPTTGAHIADAAQFLSAPTTGANDVTSGNMTIATAVTILALATDSSVVNAGNEPTVGTGFTTRLNGTGSIGSYRLETGSASTTSAATFTAIANNPHVIWAIAIANATASGAIAGTSALAFGASGTLASQGAMAGTAGLTFGATATPIIPPLQYSDTASNRNRPGRGPYSTGRFFVSDISAFTSAISGALSGTSAVSFGETGAITGTGALAGASALVVGESGALTGSGALAATSSLLFGESGALTGSGAMSATAGLVLAETGVLIGAGSLAGTSALIFSASGTLTQPGISGTAALVMGQTGVIAGAGALAASCQLTFASTSTLTGVGALAGASALTFAASGTATLPGALSGTASASFGSSATIQATGLLAGESDIVFYASAVNTQTTGQPGPVDSGVTMSDGAYRKKKRQKRIIERLVARPTLKGEPQPIFAPEFVPVVKPTRVPRETTSLADIAKPVDLTNDDEEAMAAILNALDQLEDD